jgi:hypothetical protein
MPEPGNGKPENWHFEEQMLVRSAFFTVQKIVEEYDVR